MAGVAGAAASSVLRGVSASATQEEFVPGISPYRSPNPFFTSPVWDPARGIAAPLDTLETERFQDFVRTFPDQQDLPFPKINGLRTAAGAINKWGTAYAAGQSRDPVWKLTGTVPAEVELLQTRGFHAPAWLGDMLTGTSDSPFVVQDYGFGISVWAAKASKVDGSTIRVGSTGYFEHASNGLDRRNPHSDSTVNFRSRGAIPDAMVIRAQRVRQAMADNTGLGHVLHMFFTETNAAAGFCHPMVGCEINGKNGWGAEGVRIAIRPDVDLARRLLSRPAMVVARTLQEHGAYLGDNAGGGSTLKAEQISKTRDPWRMAGVDLVQDSLKGGITWEDFFVVRRGWQAGL